MVFWCPHCKQAYVKDPHSGDFVHECNSGDDELDKESVKIIGPWVDNDGTSGTITTTEVMRAGMTNLLMGQESSKYEFDDERNIFGQKKSTYRLRQHDQYIER